MIHMKVLAPHVRSQLWKMSRFPQMENWEERKASEMETGLSEWSVIAEAKTKGNQGPDLEGYKVPYKNLFYFTLPLVIALPSLFLSLFPKIYKYIQVPWPIKGTKTQTVPTILINSPTASSEHLFRGRNELLFYPHPLIIRSSDLFAPMLR